MDKMILEDRACNLNELSGFRVMIRKEKNQNVFTFYDDDNKAIIEFWTYPKARAFALGVQIGRQRR